MPLLYILAIIGGYAFCSFFVLGMFELYEDFFCSERGLGISQGGEEACVVLSPVVAPIILVGYIGRLLLIPIIGIARFKS